MNSVIITDYGVALGKTGDRLVVRGPRPKLELIEGGPQLFLPLGLSAQKPKLTMPLAVRSLRRRLCGGQGARARSGFATAPLARMQANITRFRSDQHATDHAVGSSATPCAHGLLHRAVSKVASRRR